MGIGKNHLLILSALLMWFSASTAIAAGLPVSANLELDVASMPCQAPVLSVQNQQDPFNKHAGDHGGAGSKYISASDAVPHVSVTSVSPLTFAVVIALVNNDEHKPTPRSPVVPRQSVLHKVLFRSIISPNAP
jgi:hypothetical protein